MASRASLDGRGFSRVSSLGSDGKGRARMSYPADSKVKMPFKSTDDASAQPGTESGMQFGRVASAPGPTTKTAAGATDPKAKAKGAKVEKEAARAQFSIKELLEQRRLNDATGALVQEFFSTVSPEELSNKISEIFNELDTDHSGGLDHDEIGRAFLLVGKPLKDSDILAWLNEFDADGNGIIDEDEFAHMVRNRMGIPCAITCIPCLRGCSTVQRRSKAAPTRLAPLASKYKPAVANKDNGKKPEWGDQMLMSIAERKRAMMQNSLLSDNHTQGGKAQEEPSPSNNDKEETDVFRRTSSAPTTASNNPDMLSDKDEIEKIFKMVKRNSIKGKVDRQWEQRASEYATKSFTSVMDQINYFLVSHLKSVPLDKLPKKIKETFATIDLDNSGELSKNEVGVAFERLGKPLSAADLDAYMETVDIDGNGSVDVYEFEHMTRKLLKIDCVIYCKCCRFLHDAGKENNWGENKERAMKEIADEIERKRQEDEVMFSRVSSSPATRSEAELAEQAALHRRQQKIKKDRKSKEAALQAGLKSPHITGKSSPSRVKRSDSNSSMSSIASKSSTGRIKKSESNSSLASPTSQVSPTVKTTSPSRVASKLHGAIKASPQHAN